MRRKHKSPSKQSVRQSEAARRGENCADNEFRARGNLRRDGYKSGHEKESRKKRGKAGRENPEFELRVREKGKDHQPEANRHGHETEPGSPQEKEKARRAQPA